MRIHPGGFRLVLAGAKVSRLHTFLTGQGFQVEAFTDGGAALAALRHQPCHVLVLELEVGDRMGVDVAREVRAEQRAGAVLLLEDPIKSGQIIASLARGDVESYVAIPPDESILLRRLEDLLLAQWGGAVAGQQQALSEEVLRLKEELATATNAHEQALAALERAHAAEIERARGESRQRARDLKDERDRVKELVKEIGVLREQLSTMHLLAGVKSGVSDEGDAASNPDGAPVGPGSAEGGFDEFDGQRTMATPHLGSKRTDAEPARRAVQTDANQTEIRARPGDLREDYQPFSEQAPKTGAPGPSALEEDEEPTTAMPAFLAHDPSASFGFNDEPTSPAGHRVPDNFENAATAMTKRSPGKSPGGLPRRPHTEAPRTVVETRSPDEEEVIFLDDD
jgi:DNA-binding response OmpR family regulator